VAARIAAKFMERHSDILCRGRSDEKIKSTDLDAVARPFPEVSDLTAYEFPQVSTLPGMFRNQIVCVGEACNTSAQCRSGSSGRCLPGDRLYHGEQVLGPVCKLTHKPFDMVFTQFAAGEFGLIVFRRQSYRKPQLQLVHHYGCKVSQMRDLHLGRAARQNIEHTQRT
jgi:hypothetical protein